MICGDRLFQQYIVDAFAYVEENRLRFIIKNNENLRSGIYQVYMMHCARVILMETMLVRKLYCLRALLGVKRYMVQNYQDAMAICRFYGPPDLFTLYGRDLGLI